MTSRDADDSTDCSVCVLVCLRVDIFFRSSADSDLTSTFSNANNGLGMLHHILFFTLSEMCSHTETTQRERSVGLFWSQEVYRLYEYLLFCLLFKVCCGFRRFSTLFLSSSGFSAVSNIKDTNENNYHWLKFVAIILILICQFSF